MAAPIFQRTVVDTQGNVVAGAVVEVRNEATDELAPIFVDRPLTEVKANPFTTDSTGFIRFFASAGDYRIKATFGAEEIIFRFVQLIDTDELIDLDSAQTLENKTIAFGSNTLTNVASTNTAQTLANKTLTSPTLVTPDIGTPTSGVVTNLTGTASININGTVGATTANTGAFTTLNTSGAVVFNEAGGNFDFRVEGNTEPNLLFVHASANAVGVGTISPQSLLDVTRSEPATYISSNTLTGGQFQRISNTNTAANTAATLLFTTSASGGSGLSTISSVGTAAGSTALTFGTRNAGGSVIERVRINETGALMVNTTSISSIQGEAAALAQVAGNLIVGNAVANTNLALTINGVANKAGRIAFAESNIIQWIVGNGAASENGVFEVFSNLVGTGVQLGRSATSWSALSDFRMKDIIEPISDAAAKVSTLRAVIGKYKTDKENVRRSFLIAQDVQAVLPEAVDDINPEKLGIRYTEVIPLLVAAIKELKIANDELTARVAALESN